MFPSTRKSVNDSRRNWPEVQHKKNTVCDILKDKEKWLNIELTGSNTTKQKQKSAKFPELEEALAIWISKALAANKLLQKKLS